MKEDRFGNEALLKKLQDGKEPYFVLRAQDVFAAGLVKRWAELAESGGVPADKVQNARECARAMRNWSTKKIPD